MNLASGQLGFGAALCVVLVSCAQTGPPLPPSLELPRPPTDLRASRKGSSVTLTWTQPTLTTDRQSVRYLGSTRICRTSEAELTKCGTPVFEMAQPPRSSRQPGPPSALQSYVDTLPHELQEQNATGKVLYAVEVPNRDGRSAGLSNRVQVPAAPTLPAPLNFTAQVAAAGVVLTWDGIAETQSLPSISHRYRVYRREQDGSQRNGQAKVVVAGEVPLGEAGPVRYVDQSFEWEKTYSYRVDAVTTVNLGMRPCSNATVVGADCAEVYEIEGDDSPELTVSAHDTFPPAVPGGVQAVYSGEGQKSFIDLIWAPVTDADLQGYNVFRRDGDQAPVKLNVELVKAPAYRDDSIAAGRTYLYSVSAVDVRNNESSRSSEAGETTPRQESTP